MRHPRMPAEWESHERTWMAFPPANATFGTSDAPSLREARMAWASVANCIVGYEPVTMIANAEDVATARELVDPRVRLLEVPIDDAWLRDSGPTFTLDDDGLRATNWVFNGWGAQAWARWDHDALVATRIAQECAVPRSDSTLTNEGGGLHVDGAGTVLLTDTVQLDPLRNPNWRREDVEKEIHAQLGTSHAIWLPRGLTRDYGNFGTRGHVDIVATFVRPGVVAVHRQRDRSHPDFAVTTEIVDILRGSIDASGRALEVIEVPAPRTLRVEGEWSDYSYINHYVGNGFVLVGTFDDAHDDEAQEILRRLYPDRTIEAVDARPIFAHGGGVHCITQQQPSPNP